VRHGGGDREQTVSEGTIASPERAMPIAAPTAADAQAATGPTPKDPLAAAGPSATDQQVGRQPPEHQRPQSPHAQTSPCRGEKDSSSGCRKGGAPGVAVAVVGEVVGARVAPPASKGRRWWLW